MFEKVESNWTIKLKTKSILLADLAKEFGSPVYVYDLHLIREKIQKFKKSLVTAQKVRLFFALKANNHPGILKLLKEQNLGVDVVSLGELRLALESGFSGEEIVFSGVGKDQIEIEQALKNQVAQINVESLSELELIHRCAQNLNLVANVALRFNPDVQAQTHPYICTGLRENKFGLDAESCRQAVGFLKAHSNSFSFQGLAIHIGSQIRELSAFTESYQKTLKMAEELASIQMPCHRLDLGGGLGIDYAGQSDDLFQAYGDCIRSSLANFAGELWFEPGRCLVGAAGVLLTEVLHVKRTAWKNFVVVNTGMNHLLRPALYQAIHRIETCNERQSRKENFEIVGPICESSDVLGRDRLLAAPQPGDTLAIFDVGAYGSTMASAYNLHAWPVEVAVDENIRYVLKRHLTSELECQTTL